MKTNNYKTNDPSTPDAKPVDIRFGKLLVPLDFSEHSRQVLRAAVALAREKEGRLILLHVVEPMMPYPADLSQPGLAMSPIVGQPEPGMQSIMDNLRNTAGTHLNQWKQTEVPSSIEAETMVKVGVPHHEITSAAESCGADLILVSTHGYTGLKHVFMGSTAERVVRHAPCPVLVIPRAMTG